MDSIICPICKQETKPVLQSTADKYNSLEIANEGLCANEYGTHYIADGKQSIRVKIKQKTNPYLYENNRTR
jgi:hypothetical protein